VNETIDALNWCSGVSDFAGESVALAQQVAVDHIVKVHRESARCPRDITTQAAREELLGGPSDYGGSSSLVVTYDEQKVSIPQAGASPTPLASVLPDSDCECLERFGEKMLIGPDEWGTITQNERDVHIKPFMDKRLAGDVGLYEQFVQRLRDCGLVRFGVRSRTMVTPFFVRKKNDRQRLVIDCRPANRCFKVPPPVFLGTSSEWGGLRVGPEDTLYAAQGDIKDYFYACGIQPGLSEYFCLPPVSGNFLLNAGLCYVDDVPVDPRGNYFPQLSVMPMGWSWAFYFAQQVHKHLIQKYSNTGPNDFLEMGSPPPDLEASRCGVHAYCDNLTVFGTKPTDVQQLTDSIITGIESEGFTVHEKVEATDYVITVGVELDGLKGEVACKTERRWRLVKVMRWLGSRPLVSGKHLERAIGHATFVLMLRRPLLAVFRAVYHFIQNQPYHTPTRLSAEAARECRAAAALIPFASASLRRPVATTVSAFDACPTGMGVGESLWEEADVLNVTKFDDRWRFKLDKFDKVPARINSHLSLG